MEKKGSFCKFSGRYLGCFMLQRNDSRYDVRYVFNFISVDNETGNPANLAVTLSIDGVSFFKNGMQMWPIVGCIANLPPNLRDKQENIVIFGIFVDNKSPSIELITGPFGKIMKKNFETGIKLKMKSENFRNKSLCFRIKKQYQRIGVQVYHKTLGNGWPWYLFFNIIVICAREKLDSRNETRWIL